MSNNRLLLLETDPVLHMVLIEILSLAGYVVCDGVSPDDAVALVARSQPVAGIIAGDRRGGFTLGWAAAQRLRTAYPRLPLVMLTTNAAALQELGQTPRGNWFAAGLLKPFNVDQLLYTVAQVATHTRAHQP